MDGLRHGYGNLTETNVSGNRYYGDWSNDQCHGYGVYDDKSRYSSTSLVVKCFISLNDMVKTPSLYGHVSSQLLPWWWHYHDQHRHIL